jgi:hypothetical protein
MKREDSTSINAYILDEDTRYKVNMSHFTLGERKIRELQDRHAARLQKVQELAESLGVEYTPSLPAPATVIRNKELVLKYLERSEEYDEILDKVLSVCTPQEVIEFIDKQLNQP